MACSLSITIYVHSVDLWSFGLIIHKMIMGTIRLQQKAPSHHVTLRVRNNENYRIEYDFSAVPINADGKALLTGLLQYSPKDRQWDILKTNRWLVSPSGAEDYE